MGSDEQYKYLVQGEYVEFDIEKNHNYLTPIGIAHNGGKRLGSFAIYLEPHHSDIMEFLELKKKSWFRRRTSS